MKNKKMIYGVLGLAICIGLLAIFISKGGTSKQAITTSSGIISNKKIGWGIKRNGGFGGYATLDFYKKLLEEYNGIAMGNAQDKFVYLTFDCGYEAGYTSKILDVLKENNVKAAFFITGHYLNTASDLVKRMIDEGHIVRKPYCKSL